ncbi:hypothetical protein MLD38_013107 [Melastoma candidum]|uniref:Uncharacterized protein n=1 Tax=Melastoma candidum TaxID=119954 RepID=A0ACB9R8K9_9MYRT|nr:hypothetical protein MLD38_013107 [Melastoma candidum]
MSSSQKLRLLGLFVFAVIQNAALGEIICEHVPNEMCAFAVASSGIRCVLETYENNGGATEYQCETSEVAAEGISGYIESDSCVRDCGGDRRSVGISSDALLEPTFMAKLCAPTCYDHCPNIIDLYSNLASGEGVNLRDVCTGPSTGTHRVMMELASSGDALSPSPSPSAAPPSTSSF